MRKFIIPLAAAVLFALSCDKTKEVAVTAVSIDQTTADMTVGEKKQLTATVSPSDATDQSITWSSSKKSVATVNDHGMVTAIAEGQSTIKARAGSKTSVCIVTVHKEIIAVSSITLDKSSLSLVKGASETLVATVNPANASYKKVTWSSSDSSVATVDSEGTVKAIASGSATITAQVENIKATCAVTVTVPVESISLNKTSLTLDKGQSETLVATISPTDATENTVTWGSSNDDRATVDANGKVTALGAGSVTITAKAGGKSAACLLTVNAPVESVSLNRTSITLEEGGSFTLKATVAPKDATDKTVTWSSSDESIVTVDQDGTVQAITQGSASIVAKAGNKQATCAVTVIKSVTSISLNKESLTLLVGETSTLTATVLPEDATDKTVTWTSYDDRIATVEKGVVKGIAFGKTIISASANYLYATCPITVLIDSATGVSVVYDDNGSLNDDMVSPGSELKVGVANYSSETIHVTSVQLIDGQTGAIGYETALDADVSSGSTNTWTVTIGDSGIYSPIVRFTYTFKGETYTCDTKIVPIPRAPRRNRN